LEKDFPDWNKLYNTQNVETMPWYNENLDSDLKEELESRKISKGRILDLGTGPATQAKQLAKRGLKVTGSDVSEAAINKARELYVNNNSNKDIEINFIVDNVLNSKIKDKMFDYVFDRGCLHVLPIDKRPVYIKEIKRMLDDREYYF
jgi:ubiquinone/menaquinone biosynthesis C-methylase UbiE